MGVNPRIFRKPTELQQLDARALLALFCYYCESVLTSELDRHSMFGTLIKSRIALVRLSTHAIKRTHQFSPFLTVLSVLRRRPKRRTPTRRPRRWRASSRRHLRPRQLMACDAACASCGAASWRWWARRTRGCRAPRRGAWWPRRRWCHGSKRKPARRFCAASFAGARKLESLCGGRREGG